MIKTFALSCIDCPDSQLVAFIFMMLSVVLGIFIATVIRKKKYLRAAIIAVFVYILPLILWILDGYKVFAQSLEDPWQGGCGTCATESVGGQLAGINYGIWIFLIIIPSTITIYFVVMKIFSKKQ